MEWRVMLKRAWMVGFPVLKLITNGRFSLPIECCCFEEDGIGRQITKPDTVSYRLDDCFHI